MYYLADLLTKGTPSHHLETWSPLLGPNVAKKKQQQKKNTFLMFFIHSFSFFKTSWSSLCDITKYHNES